MDSMPLASCQYRNRNVSFAIKDFPRINQRALHPVTQPPYSPPQGSPCSYVKNEVGQNVHLHLPLLICTTMGRFC